MASRLLFLALFSSQILLSSCSSQVEFFKDKKCSDKLGIKTGNAKGVCTPAISNDGSVQVLSLDPACAATIYSDPYCSVGATIAPLNQCMAGSIIVGSFSIDCTSNDQASKPFTEADPSTTSSSSSPSSTKSTRTAGSTSTSDPSSASHTSASKAADASPSSSSAPAPASSHTISSPLLAGIIIACLFAISILPTTYFIVRYLRHRRNSAPRTTPSQYPAELGGPEKFELANGEYTPGGSRDGNDSTTRSAYGHWQKPYEVADAEMRSPGPPRYRAEKRLPQPPKPVMVQRPGVFAELPDSMPGGGRRKEEWERNNGSASTMDTRDWESGRESGSTAGGGGGGTGWNEKALPNIDEGRPF